MTTAERNAYLRETYVGKTVKILWDGQGHEGRYIGKEGIVKAVTRNDYNAYILMDVNGQESAFYLSEIQVINNEPIIHKEKSKLQLKKKSIEEVDEFGNDYILHLLPTEEQKYIYLSSSLRTLLDVKNGDFINFALDKDNKLYYICKESDKNMGYEIIDGKIQSNVEWRSLYNTFNNETTKIEAGKVKLHISHYEREQEECPDYHLFLINEPWIVIKGNVSKKKARDVMFEKSIEEIKKEHINIQLEEIDTIYKGNTQQVNLSEYVYRTPAYSRDAFNSFINASETKKPGKRVGANKQILQKPETTSSLGANLDEFDNV